MSIVIKVENLGKKYIIGHQATEGYSTLRDSITKRIKSFLPSPGYKRSEKSTKEEFWALKNINLEVHQGDRVGIIGRNGAGKSTLLKILSRITEPTEGTVKIKGRVASLLEVGTGFHPELTGRENIFLNGGILGMSRSEIKKKFDEIVDFAEVEKFLDTPVKRYSSGMGVRLAFAVAAHLDAELLLVDEVLSVGDFAFRKKCLGKMKDVGKEGRTVLFVSHDMNVIRKLCPIGILLNKGLIINSGEINSISAEYERIGFKSDSDGSTYQKRENRANLFKHFTWTNIESAKGERSNIFESGDNIVLNIGMEGEINHQDHYFQWFLYDKNSGDKISWGSSYAINNDDIDRRIKRLRVTIGPLPLAVGKYSFSYVIGVSGVMNFDFWEDAISFEITSSSINNINYQYNSELAPIVIPYKICSLSNDKHLKIQ